jgi:molybdenum cofactor synthesis domain-containing protein
MTDSPSSAPTAALVVIGNELLSGKIVDENTPYLMAQLRECGVRLCRVVTIEDDLDVIAEEVRHASEKYSWVFTSGGLGPTHDDVTVEAVGRAFGVGLVRHPDLVETLRKFKGDAAAGLDRLTWIPDGGDVFWGHNGTAHWPTPYINNVYIFPGVPKFFRARFTELRPTLMSSPFFAAAVYCSPHESELVSRISASDAAFPEVDVGSYPQFGDEDHRVRVTFDSRDRAAVEAAMAHFVAQLSAEWIVRITPV